MLEKSDKSQKHINIFVHRIKKKPMVFYHGWINYFYGSSSLCIMLIKLPQASVAMVTMLYVQCSINGKKTQISLSGNNATMCHIFTSLPINTD